ncbi:MULTISPECIES: sulfurtransferase TusA family protein [Shewanella]|nr:MULTISPECIES: sulfurtransferase TusA family protein [Shewanella]
MKTVDARGLSCPTPVVLTMQALEVAQDFKVLVDNPVALERITRMLKDKHNIVPSIENEGDDIIIHVQ